MRPWLRRFAAVGLLVTAVDLGLLLLLARGFGLPVVLADVIALTSRRPRRGSCNRTITFADDPFVRWVICPSPSWPPRWWPVPSTSSCCSLGQLDELDDGAGPRVVQAAGRWSWPPLVRLSAYRALLFTAVRTRPRRARAPAAAAG